MNIGWLMCEKKVKAVSTMCGSSRSNFISEFYFFYDSGGEKGTQNIKF